MEQKTMNPELRAAKIHLAILGKRRIFCCVAKNYANEDVITKWLWEHEIVPWAFQKNKEGYTIWISLNDKENFVDKNEGVQALCDFWLDVDRPKEVKDKEKRKPATETELKEALDRANKLQQHIETTHNAIGFLAKSGNGFHIHFPLPITPLPKEERLKTNEKVRKFAKKASAKIGAEIDAAYDIRRVTTLIGTKNLKLPETPIQTAWDRMVTCDGLEAALKYVETAREQNKELLEAILNVTYAEPQAETDNNEYQPVRPEISKILEKNPMLKDVYVGNWSKYNFKSRSEAEFELVLEFLRFGLTPAQVRIAMEESNCEKWNDTTKTAKQYKDKTIEKAAKFIKEQALKARQDSEPELKESQADRLIKYCLGQDTELFYDQHKTPFIRIKDRLRYCDIYDVSETFSPIAQDFANMSKEEKERGLDKVSDKTQKPQYRKTNRNMPIKNKFFKTWLANLMWETEEKAPGSEGLNSAMNVLMGKALSEGKEYTLYNRVAPASDGIWLDMADKAWRAIKITPSGWAIMDDPPILFKRFNHQKALVVPEKVSLEDAPEKIELLFNYLNIRKNDDITKLTFLCNVISYLIPLIPHPLLVTWGPQGAAKTWLFRFIRRLIDPSAIEVLSLPRDDRELAQQLDHHWIAFYDNLTYVPTWASDMFCRAATGAGFSKRELYSDDNDTIYSFKRCIGLNGINPAARKGDLLDRSTLICLEKINNNKRKTEQELIADFEKDKAVILGAILTIVSEALRLYPEIRLTEYFRMADFTRFGCAIAQALGKTKEEFIEAYKKKVELQNEEAVNADPVALVILDFCKKHFQTIKGTEKLTHENWEGTPTKLLQEITVHAQVMGINTKSKFWPTAANAFSRRVNTLSASIQALGFEIIAKGGNPRKFIIRPGIQIKLDVKDPEKPILNVYKVFNGEPCGCGLYAVTMELHDTVENTRKSYCDSCGKAEKKWFFEHGYNIVYPSSEEAS
jgi:hypothetical protein